MKNREKDNQCVKMWLGEKEKVDEFVALMRVVYEEPRMTRPEAVRRAMGYFVSTFIGKYRKEGMK